MQLCKLIVIGSDKVQVIQCRSENPASFVVQPSGLSEEDVQNALYLRLEWYDSDVLHFAVCSVKEFSDGRLAMSPVSEVQRDDSEQFHIIDTYETVEFRHVSESELADYKQKIDNINRRFRNSLTSQIKNILSDEPLTNQFIFKLLLQIDGKLDELLAHKLDGITEGLLECRMLAMSGAGLYFTADNASVGEYFFIQSTPKYTTNFIFAALCRVKEVIKAPSGVIVITEFAHLDETSRDSVVHFVFEKERDKLKRIRANV